MAFKFPFTNYHELNLTWVLDQLKKLFEESAENVTTIQNYDGRLTAVETELPAVAENASEASRAAAAAGTLAQMAKTTADTAQENAVQAQSLAGTARQEAQNAQTAADAAIQAAQQAQATALNFDGRITQAENDASQALEASRSFENRVQSAITTANNAARTATDAQGVAQNANQNAATALDRIGTLSDLHTASKQNLVVAINETLEKGGGNCTDCAPLIINNASGKIASFSDGADSRHIRKISGTIEPIQAGSGDPSLENKRPISGRTSGTFIVSPTESAADGGSLSVNWENKAGLIYGGILTLNDDESVDVIVNMYKFIADGSNYKCDIKGYNSDAGLYYYRIKPLPQNAQAPYILDCSSMFKSTRGVPENNSFYTNVVYNCIYCWLNENITVSQFNNRLASDPVEFCIKSATNTPYHFNDIGYLYTFLGVNNVWITTGDITECLYPADTKLYIDGKIAELQALALENNG